MSKALLKNSERHENPLGVEEKVKKRGRA